MISSFVALCCLDLLMITLEGTTGTAGNTFESVESRLFRKYVFTNASKHWNHYVRKLLHNSLEIYFSKSNQYHLCDKTLLSGLNYLVQSSRKIVAMSKQVKPLWFYFKIKFSSITLIQPLTTHRIELDEGHFFVHFHLHPNLDLNMTFHYIYFSSNTFLKGYCYFGTFIVWNRKLYHPYVHHRVENISRFEYCGIVPSFKLYLSSNKVTLEIYVRYFVSFSSMISHSVIDSHKIKSYHVKNKNSVAPISVMRFLISESYLLKYKIQVESFEMLNILYNISQYELIEVYDGPGELYNLLEPFASKGNMVLFTTTTFQTFIFLCIKKKTYHVLFMTYNVVMSMSTQKDIYVEKNHMQLIISEVELNNTEIAIMKIETQEHYFLNITIQHMEYEGKNHSSCGFAGVTSYDITGNRTFSKISTICHSNNNQEYRYRNIYTQNSMILLVVYSYKKYSNFNLTLSVTTTQCKATMMNICELPHDPLSLEATSYFSVRKHNCIVLQLDYGDTNMSLFKMSRRFYTPSEDYYTTYIETHLVRRK